MPSCSVCGHAYRDTIDRELVDGASVRDVAGRHSLSRSAVHRHQREHLSAQLVKVTARRQARREESLTDRLARNLDRLEALLDGADDGRLSVAALAETRKHLELLGRLTGELNERSQSLTINLTQSSEWTEVRSLILGALAPFPEAKSAVVAALTGGRVIEGTVIDS